MGFISWLLNHLQSGKVFFFFFLSDERFWPGSCYHHHPRVSSFPGTHFLPSAFSAFLSSREIPIRSPRRSPPPPPVVWFVWKCRQAQRTRCSGFDPPSKCVHTHIENHRHDCRCGTSGSGSNSFLLVLCVVLLFSVSDAMATERLAGGRWHQARVTEWEQQRVFLLLFSVCLLNCWSLTYD